MATSKADLITETARSLNIPRSQVNNVVNEFLSQITLNISVGEPVHLNGFGTFEVHPRKARVGRNILTKETVQIPARQAAVFRAGKTLKEAVRDIPVD